MTYALPFSEAVELGGGSAPFAPGKWPNVDVREAPGVDIVSSLDAPLPFADGAVPNIFSKYAAEHISWRSVAAFFAECHRVLAPGGVAVFVVPNLLEQCRLAVERGDAGEWDHDNGVPCMIFGDLDYPENSHKAGWSPESICRELRAAGFASVLVLPWGALGTDMIVEAHKL